MDHVICKNKKPLRIFLEFYFNVGCTNNMPSAPNKALLTTHKLTTFVCEQQ